MECIPEEAVTAFDNQAYIGINFPQASADSGFASYEEVASKQKFVHQKYENVDFRESPTPLENIEENRFPSYEDLEEESYENIEPPLNYQNVDFVMPLPPPILPPPTLQSLPNLSNHNNEAESYENLQFQSLTDPTSNKIPVYAISTKKKNSAPIAMDEEEAPVYENYDFQEEAIYQNMLVNRSGKLQPAKVNQQQGNSKLLHALSTQFLKINIVPQVNKAYVNEVT